MATQTIPKDIYKIESNEAASGLSVLILTDDKTEDLEFFYPYYRFAESGCRVDVVTPKGKSFEAKHGLGLQETKKISDVNAADYQLLYIPGGKAPASLKENQDALKLTKTFVQSGKIVASICHGPQVLAAAGVIHGKKIAAWPEVKSEVTEAGAQYVNEKTVTDGQFITARWPADLPWHMKTVLEALMASQSKSTKPSKAA